MSDTAQAGRARIPRWRILVLGQKRSNRDGIAALVHGQPDLVCCGTVTADKAGAVVARENPDLLVIEAAVQQGDALDLANSLHLQFPYLRMLILSEDEDAAYAERALQLGARGCVLQTEPPVEVLTAIRTVLNDKIFLSHNLSVGLLQRMLKPGSCAEPQDRKTGGRLNP